jgi:hypothetical protein
MSSASSGLFSAKITDPAERFLEGATAKEREEIAHIIDSILCYDPYVDGHHKIPISIPPAVVTLYFDERFWIIYHIVRNTEIRIWNIGHAHEPRTPFRHKSD